MKKKVTMIFSFLLMCLMLLYAAQSMSMTLPLPMVQQEQTQWCWAGSTKAIESYYGKSANECDMATYYEGRNNWGGYNCCQYAIWSLPSQGNVCNQPNYLTYPSPGNVQEIMSTKYGTPSTYVGSSLAQPAVQTEIYAGRPFEMGWSWTGGGGHALVGYGITGNTVYYMDPWRGNPQPNYANYTWVVSSSNGTSTDHTWTQTIKPSITPQPLIPDIDANGMDGSVSVSHTTPVNITVELNAGGFTNTNADLWVAAYLNGVVYYQNSSGQWTTQAVPRAQGPIVSFAPVSVFYSALPVGTSMTFYVAVDLTMDGIVDSPYYYDAVTVTAY